MLLCGMARPEEMVRHSIRNAFLALADIPKNSDGFFFSQNPVPRQVKLGIFQQLSLGDPLSGVTCFIVGQGGRRGSRRYNRRPLHQFFRKTQPPDFSGSTGDKMRLNIAEQGVFAAGGRPPSPTKKSGATPLYPPCFLALFFLWFYDRESGCVLNLTTGGGHVGTCQSQRGQS